MPSQDSVAFSVFWIEHLEKVIGVHCSELSDLLFEKEILSQGDLNEGLQTKHFWVRCYVFHSEVPNKRKNGCLKSRVQQPALVAEIFTLLSVVTLSPLISEVTLYFSLSNN